MPVATSVAALARGGLWSCLSQPVLGHNRIVELTEDVLKVGRGFSGPGGGPGPIGRTDNWAGHLGQVAKALRLDRTPCNAPSEGSSPRWPIAL